MNKVSLFNRITVPSEAAPLPKGVQDGLDTVIFWVQVIGGSMAVLGLMVLGISLFFSHRNQGGEMFMSKVSWWAAGALIFGLAAVIAPIFLGMGGTPAPAPAAG